MYLRLHVKFPLFLSDVIKLGFSRKIFERKVQISSFIKIRPLGAGLFHEERRTDMTKLIVALRNFANATKKWVKAGDVLQPP
jgi:hypothetical protein